jgi:integrase
MSGLNTVQPIRNKKHIELLKKELTGRDRLLFVLGINLALRISDLIELKIGDLRGKNHIIVKERKTGKGRRIKLNKSVVNEINKITGDNEEYLFPSRNRDKNGNTKPISRQQAYNIINGAVRDLGLLDEIGLVGTHTMRKTLGYHAYKNGEDLSRLQSLFGHSSQAVTLRYIGITDDDIDSIYETTCL